MIDAQSIQTGVKEYYGQVLGGKQDLKTSACCTNEALPTHIKEVLISLDDEVLTKFYGCGSPIPFELQGQTILDLGCGTGRDVFVASKLAGETGRVIGVDMTEEQLEVAKRHLSEQTKKFGFATPNAEFHHGYIEDLSSLGIQDASVDVVISNCVLNLSPVKKKVFAEIFRVLKPGGELYFSDVFADRRLPEAAQQDPVLVGECLGGALYFEDFRRLLLSLGCKDFRYTNIRPLEISAQEVKDKVGVTQFYSATVRAFRLDSLEDCCEDYGQFATYQGSIPESPHGFLLDDHHFFVTGKPMAVCGNTAAMVGETRYAKHFQITGDRSQHFGLFDCSPSPINPESSSNPGACC